MPKYVDAKDSSARTLKINSNNKMMIKKCYSNNFLIYIIDLKKTLHISKHYMAENVVIDLSSMKATTASTSPKEETTTPLKMSTNSSCDNLQNLNETTPQLENYVAIEKQLTDVMDSLTSMKQFITQVQGKVRGLDKLIKKEQKNTVKMSEKKNRGNRKPSGFAKPDISDGFVFFMKKRVYAFLNNPIYC